MQFRLDDYLAADGNGDGIVNLEDLAIWQEHEGLTMLETIGGDFNEDGVVDMADNDGTLTPTELDLWEENFGLVRADLFPIVLNADGGLSFEIPLEAPQVTGVTAGGAVHDDYDFGSVVGSGEQLRTVPVGGLNSISIKFSEEVLVTQNALTLTPVDWSPSMPAVDDFTYDVATQTATWTFESALPTGQYLIQLSDSVFDLDHDALDGEFVNPWSLSEAAGLASTFPSGDGAAGGEFRFRFTNSPGDFDRDNVVGSADQDIWDENAGMTSGAGHGNGDATGDGAVNGTDYLYWLANVNRNYTNWVSVEPGMILVSTAADENDANYSLGDLSLREALALAATSAGTDTIVFQPTITEIPLNSQLTINSDVNIVGRGAQLLELDAQGGSRVFTVNSGVTASLSRVTITGGLVTGTNDGGGIYNSGTLDLDSVVLVDNESAHYGGAIYNSGGVLRINDTTLEANVAARGAGVYYNRNLGVGSLTVSNSAFLDNDASGHGGGLYIYSWSSPHATAAIVNSTFSGNTAAYGGAIITNGSPTINIVNSTITENAVTQQGGGINNLNSLATIVIHNSIVWGNTAGISGTRNIAGSLDSSSSYNLLRTGSTGGLTAANGNIILGSTDSAGLTTLGNYGGSTKTHALLNGSPAIDAGGLVADLYDLVFDQRGEDRIADGDDDELLVVDIGAFELAFDEDYS
jgi:hypothetical protein